MSANIFSGPPRKPGTAIVRLYRRAVVRWVDCAYGRALRRLPHKDRRLRRLAQRRTRARVALYAARGGL